MEQTGNGEKPSLMAVLKEKASACMNVVREKIPVYWNMACTKTTETWKSGTKGKVICSSVVVIALALLMMVFIGKSSTPDESVTVGSSTANTTTAITSGSTGTDTTTTAVERKLPDEPLFIYTHLGFYMPGYTNCFMIGHEYLKEEWHSIGDRFDPNVCENEKWKVAEDKCGEVWVPLERKIEPFKEGISITANTGFISSMYLVTKETDDESDARDDFAKAKELLGSKYELSDITSEMKPIGDIAYPICLRDKTLHNKTGVKVSLALVKSMKDGSEKWFVMFMISAEEVMERSIAFARKNGDLNEGVNDMRFGGWSLGIYSKSPYTRVPYNQGSYATPLDGRFSDFSFSVLTGDGIIDAIELWAPVVKFGAVDDDGKRNEQIKSEMKKTRRAMEEKYGITFKKEQENSSFLEYVAAVHPDRIPALFMRISGPYDHTCDRNSYFCYKVELTALELFNLGKNRVLERINANKAWYQLSDGVKQGNAQAMFDLAMWYKKKSNTNWFDPRYEEWGPAYFGRFSDMYDNSNYKKTEEKIRELIDSAAKKGNADALKFLGKDKADKENRDIQDLWYVDFSKLEKGRLYAVSLYKVLTVRDDIIIATWDVAQAYKAKQFMRKWSGDGGGLIGDVIRNSENASMPDILIKPKREFADGDPILGMKVRYLGIVKTQFGAIRAFEEVQK